jgi:hypothetical protein
LKLDRYISLLLFCLTGLSSVQAQISPGPLAKAHAHLEGINNCTKCHSIGNAVTNKNCLACHKEIQTLISQKRGYHVSPNVKSKQCVDCHNDHHGLKFEMTRFDQKKFNHKEAGYVLKEAHATLDCKDCHQPSKIGNAQIKKRENTFLGLEQSCISCHKDEHQGTLSKNCASCHNENKFKPATGFNHDKARFKLKGAHTKEACINCHKITIKNGEKFQEFKGLKFSTCTSCHKDVHDGKFGNNCLKCHTEESFKNPNITGFFDHNQTNYPLSGMHTKVDCKSCHKAGSYTKTINTNQCKNCHTDYHMGDFAKNDLSPDCKECHSLQQAFSFSSFGIIEHEKASFNLEGGHLATPCSACHKSEEKWKFKFKGTQCVDCHKDIHQGKLSEKYYVKQDCKQCHNSEIWSDVTFEHERTGWKLEGKHAKSSCRECHFIKENISDSVPSQRFASLTQKCTECHKNIHGDQFAVEGETDCIRCHSVLKDWKINNFNHSKTNFPLVGKHVDVECKACHKETVIENEKERRIYKLSKYQCIDCHS